MLVLGFLSFAGLASPLVGRRFAAAVSAGAAAYTALLYTIVALTDVNGPLLPLDRFSALVVAMAAASIAAVVVGAYEIYSKWEWGESIPAVAALALLGAVALTLSTNVVLLYAAWILGAAATYIIVALSKDEAAGEAAVKYAVLGGIASVLFVAGLGYYYVASKTLDIGVEAAGLYALAAAALVVSSAGFKLGVVPYHGWVPDVYGHVRPFLVAVAAPAAKAIAILVLVRILSSIELSREVTLLLALLAALTMTLGNLAAAAATRPQLVLAYSSIAQAGYLLAGAVGLTLGGAAAALAATGLILHVAGYALSKASAFLALDVAAAKDYTDLHGLWHRDPPAAAGLALSLASLMGIPPTLGFWGKLYIVLSIATAMPSLAILMAANFAIGAFYYSKLIISAMHAGQASREATARGIASLVLGVLTVLVGLAPWIASPPTIYGFYFSP